MANEQGQAQDNTVMEHPEQVFRSAWLSIQWKAMARSGKGYRQQPRPTRREQAADAARMTPAK